MGGWVINPLKIVTHAKKPSQAEFPNEVMILCVWNFQPYIILEAKMGYHTKWIFTIGLSLTFMFGTGIQVGAEDPGMKEVIDIFKSVTKHLEEGNYAAASADLDYGNQLWREQKGLLLAGCMVKTFEQWNSKGEASIQTAGSAVLGGGTTITQQFSQKRELVKAEIVVSPVASGLGALLSNPALLGGGKGRVRRFADGVTAHVEKGKITAQIGNAMVSWKGNIAPADLWTVADKSINRQCVKDLS